MAKGQSHKQSMIGRHIAALMKVKMFSIDPSQRQEYQKEIDKAWEEWKQAGWEHRFPHHYRDGKLIDREQGDAQDVLA